MQGLIGFCVGWLNPTCIPDPDPETAILLMLSDPGFTVHRFKQPLVIKGENATYAAELIEFSLGCELHDR